LVLYTPNSIGTSHISQDNYWYFIHAITALHTRYYGTSHTLLRYFTHHQTL